MGVSRYNSEGCYGLPFALVIACILVAAVATVAGATFPQTLIDDYILPMLNTGSTDFSTLGASIARLACILAVGVAAAFGYNRIMVTVSQGTMRRLRDSADKANRYANLLMPINANIGWLSYVLVAIVGAVLGINGLAGVTLGTVVTFVGLNKSFTNPITQISMQVNFVVTAAAGAQRVFALMDQTPEADDGYVELVNAKENADGPLSESAERTNVRAWKHPHKALGTITCTKLEGSVVLDDVDFGYTPEKRVLHNISLWAKPGQVLPAVHRQPPRTNRLSAPASPVLTLHAPACRGGVFLPDKGDGYKKETIPIQKDNEWETNPKSCTNPPAAPCRNRQN